MEDGEDDGEEDVDEEDEDEEDEEEDEPDSDDRAFIASSEDEDEEGDEATGLRAGAGAGGAAAHPDIDDPLLAALVEMTDEEVIAYWTEEWRKLHVWLDQDPVGRRGVYRSQSKTLELSEMALGKQRERILDRREKQSRARASAGAGAGAGAGASTSTASSQSHAHAKEQRASTASLAGGVSLLPPLSASSRGPAPAPAPAPAPTAVRAPPSAKPARASKGAAPM